MTLHGATPPVTGPAATDADGALPRPVIDRQRFVGPEGMRSMPIEGRFESRDAEGFEAELSRVQLGPIVLRRTRMTPHRAIVDGSDPAAEGDILRLLTVQSGTVYAAPPGGRPQRVGTGDALLTSRTRTYAYQADEPVVVVAATLPVSSLPAVVQHLEGLPIGPLPHTPLVDAVVELLWHLSARLDEAWTFDAEFAARGLIDLQAAILTELIPAQTPPPGPERVHRAAVEYIERHLSDVDLRPPQIAAALGVSLRYLHRAFDDRDLTVARHIRERRLERVAAALRAAERRPDLRTLALRHGFADQEQLARAFHRRYGTSMTAYRAADR